MTRFFKILPACVVETVWTVGASMAAGLPFGSLGARERAGRFVAPLFRFVSRELTEE